MKTICFDESVLERRGEIADGLRRLLPADCVIEDEVGRRPFETDALTAYRQSPLVVALPRSTAEVAAVLRYCSEQGIKVTPRGAGTSLSGGALPLRDGVLLGLSKLNRILDIDYANRTVTAQPGVTNLGVTRAVEADGFYYAPDPSSQIACTIGGNVAENSGGVHCLKYGLTTNNILGLEMVTIEGEVIRLGGKHLDAGGMDIMGLMTGSEGLLAVVTEVTVRILPKPKVVGALMIGFASTEAAGACVAQIIASGMVPAAMEMMDRPAVAAAEAFVHAGYPLDVEALLIIELDGSAIDVELLTARTREIAAQNGAVCVHTAADETERLRFWAGRKAAFPAVGRLAPDYLCMDGTIPRRRLPEVLAGIEALSQRYGLAVANVFHAGDGNLHPLILYDAHKPGELDQAEALGDDILRLCLAADGVLTGEHGVGIEKRDLMPEMFTEGDLDQQRRVKAAFDAASLLNPGKVFPELRRCAEGGREHVHHGTHVHHPDLPRF